MELGESSTKFMAPVKNVYILGHRSHFENHFIPRLTINSDFDSCVFFFFFFFFTFSHTFYPVGYVLFKFTT